MLRGSPGFLSTGLEATPGSDQSHRHSELGAGGVSQASVGDCHLPRQDFFSQHLGSNLCLPHLGLFRDGACHQKVCPRTKWRPYFSLTFGEGGGGQTQHMGACLFVLGTSELEDLRTNPRCLPFA